MYTVGSSCSVFGGSWWGDRRGCANIHIKPWLLMLLEVLEGLSLEVLKASGGSAEKRDP